ncbi:hypothetical protein NHX12_021322 [Muraenolepis orangiensis]|uniref:Uncharacterized protein n=1 Tax=Muraenolepis orangiensis TaxID=630683 RepID=A0A9Q0IW08_9TELE|nr:hypothetical protein NHX12_021322 [Muraenolepis orangiensis]
MAAPRPQGATTATRGQMEKRTRISPAQPPFRQAPPQQPPTLPSLEGSSRGSPAAVLSGPPDHFMSR